jgi:hypothetical protein
MSAVRIKVFVKNKDRFFHRRHLVAEARRHSRSRPERPSPRAGQDEDIADVMQTPVGTVLSRLHRGRTQSRSLPADHAPGPATAAT